MDKIAKALKKLTNKERKQVKLILNKIQKRNFTGLNFKKLKARDDIYRVRKGRIRIIFRLLRNEEIYILTIERRSDTTYK